MPGVYIGTSSLKCAYVGTTPVKCIYVGTTKVRPSDPSYLSFMIVGGGGAGGAGWYNSARCGFGGGGGAGGVREESDICFAPGTYCVKVGAGGCKDDFSASSLGCGCPSRICGNGVNYAVCGGGYGGGAACSASCTSVSYFRNGGNGGSGGGSQGGTYCGTGCGVHTGCGVGYSGGVGSCGGSTRSCGGGGGGGAGADGIYSGYFCRSRGGYGGIGICTTFFGAAKCIAGGGNGGGCISYNQKNTGSGSSSACTYGGGCGAGCCGCGGDATCYGGGGGGGSVYPANGCILKGGHGYQGIVGIRYPASCGYNITGGCKYSCTIGGVNYCIHCFTSDGTLTVS